MHMKRPLIKLLLSDYLLYKKELNVISRCLNIKSPTKISTNELLYILRKYLVVKKLEDLNLNKLAERHIQINELYRIEKLNDLSYETLKKLGELQRIKNYNILSQEDLIYVLLRSRNSNEDNYISNIINRIDTSVLDNELRAMIKYIREDLTRLGSIITNKERTKFTKELYETFKKMNNTNQNTRLRKTQKERLLNKLIDQNNFLVRKERFMHSNYDHLQYQGITEIKPMHYCNILDEYYEPELFDSVLEKNYEMYRINWDNDKELSLIDYLNTVRPNAVDLKTKKKVNERKVQLAISLIFLNYITHDTVEKYVHSDLE